MPLSDRFKAPTAVHPFHILSIQGRPKSGKLHLACTAPPRIAIQSTDFGTDGVLQKWDDFETRFLVAEYPVNIDVTADAVMQAAIRAKNAKKESDRTAFQESVYAMAEEQAARIRKESLEPFIQDYRDLLETADIRTIVWDKATEVNEMVRLSHHGKLEKNPRIAYGPINTEFKSLVRLAAEHRKNLILIHDMTEIYVGDEPSGRWRLKGNGSVEGIVHSYVLVEKSIRDQRAVFTTTIRDSRWAPAAVGRQLEMAEWPMLMMELMPEVKPEVWLE